MSNKELSKEESLALITNMIGQAKRNVAKGGSFYFLLWGWVIMLANLGHYTIEKYDLYEHPYIVWILVIPAMIASMVYGTKKERAAGVTSHYDRVYSTIWISIFISIMTILIFMGKLSFNHNAVILLFSGMGTFLSGSLLRFKPLMFGGIALWVASIVAFNVSIIDQYLVAAVGLIVGYLIPGYLLKKVEK
jgi:hypothetical protein